MNESARATLSPPSATEQCHDLLERGIVPLSDLCSGSFHAVHPEVRARFTVAACEYTESPIRNVVVAPLAPGDGSAFKWIDTGDVGIVGVFDPKQLTRKLTLTLIGRESGKFLIDIDAPAGGAR